MNLHSAQKKKKRKKDDDDDDDHDEKTWEIINTSYDEIF